MRKIKFRAWDKESNKIINNVAFELLVEGNLIINEETKLIGNPFKLPQLIVMQYTGLKDRNGKEIYEGDVLRFDPTLCYGITTGIVEFSEFEYGEGADRFGCLGWNIKDDGTRTGTAWTETFPEVRNIEVIGNIYENPELLKVTGLLKRKK